MSALFSLQNFYSFRAWLSALLLASYISNTLIKIGSHETQKPSPQSDVSVDSSTPYIYLSLRETYTLTTHASAALAASSNTSDPSGISQIT